MKRRPVVGAVKREHNDEPLVTLTIRVPRELRQRLREHCVVQDYPLQNVITTTIREALRRQQG